MKTTMLALVARSLGVLLAVNIRPRAGRRTGMATGATVVFTA